jgi:lipopolysaccharide/colanic/teichoic acid biosynthesis glycosyltransferase
MRHHLALAVDLTWVALSAVAAVYIRDNFVPYDPHLVAIIPYTAIAVATCAVVFVVAGLNRTLWQYTELPDVLRLTLVVTIALLFATFVSFAASRLEGVARSVPLIQWFLLVGAMVGTRVAVRLWYERASRDRSPSAGSSVQHVIVVGLSHLTELYLKSVAEYALDKFDVVGILSEQRELRGRSLRLHKILGTPEKLPQVMAKLEVHGILVERIVVTQAFEELSRQAQDALLALEQGSSVKVDWLVESLGLTESSARDRTRSSHNPPAGVNARHEAAGEWESLSLGRYGYVKRGLDILVAALLLVFLAPVFVVIAVLVAVDVGFPVVFWQSRPGRSERRFKLFKFCTMRPAHDAQGKRVSDDERSSIVGKLLRQTKLDELPQLHNVLVGEMSFVGPRPLLPVDQPAEEKARLSVRPGITGLAQVCGGNLVSAEDKNALDVWYICNASLWLDIKIMLLTPIVLMRADRIDYQSLGAARAGLECLKT